jgi:hypothetical protein
MEKLPELKLAITLIVIGIPGWYFGSILDKAGPGTTTTYMGIITIVIGIALLGWVLYKNVSRSEQTEPVNPEILSGSRLSPREMNSFKIGALASVVLAFSLNLLLKIPDAADKIWFITGLYCGVTIAGFIVFYLAGYFLLFRQS